MSLAPGPPSGHWLTPRRLLQGLPAAAGLLVALLLAGFWLRPQLERHRNLARQISSMAARQQELPGLERQQQDAAADLHGARRRRDRALALLAGPGQLDGMLTALADQARGSGVALTLYSPGLRRPATASTGETTGQQGNGGSPGHPGAAPGSTQQQAPPDPLLQAGFERRQARLEARGTFLALQGFLQGLERLRPLLVISDLTLTRAAPPASGDAAVTAAVTPATPLLLELELSAYGRSPTMPAAHGATEPHHQAVQ